MTINEWFRRLNMQQYAPKLKKLKGIKRVADLKYLDEGALTEVGMTSLVDRRRVMEMIQGEDSQKMLFNF